MQLIRATQEKAHRRLGGSKPIDFDIRILSATNRDLRAMVQQGTFRQELYYRLNVVGVDLPPLRERTSPVRLWIAVTVIVMRGQGTANPARTGVKARALDDAVRDGRSG